MSYNISNIVQCPNIQTGLENAFFSCDKSLTRENTQLVDFLRSDTNTNGFLQQAVTQRGKIKTVELVWSPRYIPGNVTDSAVLVCEGGAKLGDLSETCTVDPDEGVSVPFSFSPRDYVESCRSMEDWWAQHLQIAFNVLTWRIEQRAWAAVALNVGEFASPENQDATLVTTATKVCGTSCCGDAYSHEAIEDVIYEAMEATFCSVPYVFGHGLMTRYMKALAAGCCADALSIDLGLFAAQNAFPYFHARESIALGQDNFVAIEAGAVQMVTYNEFFPEHMMEYDKSVTDRQVRLTDPFSGLEFDVHINYDCGVINAQVKLAFNFCFPPAQLFGAGDRLEGTNGILQFAVDNTCGE